MERYIRGFEGLRDPDSTPLSNSLMIVIKQHYRGFFFQYIALRLSFIIQRTPQEAGHCEVSPHRAKIVAGEVRERARDPSGSHSSRSIIRLQLSVHHTPQT